MQNVCIYSLNNQTVKILNTIGQQYIKYCFQKHRVNVGIVLSILWKVRAKFVLQLCDVVLLLLGLKVITGLFAYLTLFRLQYIQYKHITFSDPSTGLVSFVFECNINKVLLKTILYILLSILYLKQYILLFTTYYLIQYFSVLYLQTILCTNSTLQLLYPYTFFTVYVSFYCKG